MDILLPVANSRRMIMLMKRDRSLTLSSELELPHARRKSRVDFRGQGLPQEDMITEGIERLDEMFQIGRAHV